MDKRILALIVGGGAFALIWLLRRPASAAELIAQPIYFEYDSAMIKEEGQLRLAQLVRVLGTDQQIEIVGHTDNVGGAAYNHTLGMQRAEAVAAFLLTLGIREGSIADIRSAGLTEPIANNDTDEGRALNRRVEINLL